MKGYDLSVLADNFEIIKTQYTWYFNEYKAKAFTLIPKKSMTIKELIDDILQDDDSNKGCVKIFGKANRICHYYKNEVQAINLSDELLSTSINWVRKFKAKKYVDYMIYLKKKDAKGDDSNVK